MRKTPLFGLLLGVLLISGEAAAAKSSYGSSSTVVYNGVTYNYSSSSTCVDGTAALRLNRKWWCPASAVAPTPTGSTTTSTTTTTTPTPTTTAPVVYNAQVSWSVPATREDGTPLTASELAGYEVYYTSDSGSVSVVVPVAGGTTVNTVVPSLSSGNYYFSISAIDTNGLKSPLSSVAAISFP